MKDLRLGLQFFPIEVSVEAGVDLKATAGVVAAPVVMKAEAEAEAGVEAEVEIEDTVAIAIDISRKFPERLSQNTPSILG